MEFLVVPNGVSAAGNGFEGRNQQVTARVPSVQTCAATNTSAGKAASPLVLTTNRREPIWTAILSSSATAPSVGYKGLPGRYDFFPCFLSDALNLSNTLSGG